MPWYLTWLVIWVPASAMLVGALVAGRRRVRRALLDGALPSSVLLVFGAVIAAFGLLAQPTGDEPHYLVMTQSLLRDGDLMVRDNYENADYRAYYPYDIPDPHVTVVGETWHPIHNFGLPLIALLPFAVGGRAAVVVLMAAISVCGVAVVWFALRRAGIAPGAAVISTATTALTLPLVSLAGQIYPDVVAFLLVAVGCWAIFASRMGRAEQALLLAAVVLLPWFHVKYAAVSAGLLLAAAVAHRRPVLPSLPSLAVGALLLAASVALWWAVSRMVFGIFPPGTDALLPQEPGTVGWQELIGTHFLSGPLIGLVGTFLDQQSGLFLASPVYVLAIPGIALVHARPRLAISAAIVFLSVYLPAGFWGVWHAEGSSPARFMLPTVPVLALGLASVLSQAGRIGRRLFAILAVPSLVHGYLMLSLPSFVRYGDPDSHRNYFVAQLERLTGLDLTPVVPTFRDVTPLTWVTAMAYVAAIAVATVVVLRAARDAEARDHASRHLRSAA